MIIAAGGSGKRMGGATPKQFLRINGTPIILRTIHAFDAIPLINQIVVVPPLEYVDRVFRMVTRAEPRAIVRVVSGGKDRQASVWEGLVAFPLTPDIVLVHDAVRPLVSKKIILDVIKAVKKYGSGVVGVRVKDTLKLERRKGFYAKTVDRSRMWSVQTPQGFSYEVLRKAHRSARRARFVGTDEASLVERLGIEVKIVEGDYLNLKITTPDDIKLARILSS